MSKLATMQLPDSIYNWVQDFFTNRYHCTRYAGRLSTVAGIKAIVIQGSGLGPASYVVTAADPHPCTIGNRIFKCADDTYLVVPATNSSTRCLKIEHIGVWAAQNNLTLNCGFSMHNAALYLLGASLQENFTHVQSSTTAQLTGVSTTHHRTRKLSDTPE